MNFDNINLLPMKCRQSSMSCALSCRRKWFCQYRLGIVLRGGEFKASANLGTIYHKFQQAGPDHITEVLHWVIDWQKRLMEQVDKGEDIDGNLSRTASMLTEHYNKALVMARIFWEKYPQPSYFKTIGTEIKHTVQLDGLTISGTIDKLFLNEQDGTIWIRDHKSTGDSIEKIFSGIAWSLQGRIYRILASSYMGDLWESNKESGPMPHIRGFILDGIMHPGIKQCRTDQKNAKEWKCSEEEAYLRRVKEWYNEQMEAAIRSRSMIFNEPIIPDELKEVFGLMRDLEGRGNHPNAYRRDVSRKACFEYKKQCIYHDLCETSPEQWDGLFDTKYKFVDIMGETKKLNDGVEALNDDEDAME